MKFKFFADRSPTSGPEEPVKRTLRPDDWAQNGDAFVGIEEESECYDWTPADVIRIHDLGQEYWFYVNEGGRKHYDFKSPKYDHYLNDAIRKMRLENPESVMEYIRSLMVLDTGTFGVEKSDINKIQVGEARHRIPPKTAMLIFQRAIQLAIEHMEKQDPDIVSRFTQWKARNGES